MLRKVRAILWLLVLVAAAAAAFLLFRRSETQPAASQQTIAFRQLGGPFTLTSADGQPFSSAKLSGRPYAIFFGFTHCPDVCPTTLARLARLRQQLGQEGQALQIVFVSVDPERDGPEDVGKYAELFGVPIIGLTGSPAQIEQVKKQYGIFSQKAPDESGGGYSVDHTAITLLFGRDGKFVSTIAPEEPDAAALDKMRRILA